ncbi:hypothetical protein NBRC116493_02550 [Aurantivibrio infirmus]
MNKVAVIGLQIIFLATTVVWLTSWLYFKVKAYKLSIDQTKTGNFQPYKIASLIFLVSLVVWVFGIGLPSSDAGAIFYSVLFIVNFAFLIITAYCVYRLRNQIQTTSQGKVNT